MQSNSHIHAEEKDGWLKPFPVFRMYLGFFEDFIRRAISEINMIAMIIAINKENILFNSHAPIDVFG